MTPPRRIAAHTALNLRDILGGRDLIDVAPTPARTYPLTILSAEKDHLKERYALIDEAVREGRVNSLTLPPLPPFRFRIHRLDHAGAEPVFLDLPETEKLYFQIAPLGDTWLLIQSRIAEDVPNADVYDASGRLLRSFRVGDGVAQVQTTVNNEQIWMGYIDEGIFGGTEYGREGAMGFRSDGTPLFRLHSGEDFQAFGLETITECYALNVTPTGDTWLYTFENGFSLIRIRDGRIRSVRHHLPVGFGRAFAVTETHALFAGGYGDSETLHRLSLTDENAEPEAYLPVTPDGDPIVFGNSLPIGCGSLLYLFREDELFVIEASAAI